MHCSLFNQSYPFLVCEIDCGETNNFIVGSILLYNRIIFADNGVQNYLNLRSMKISLTSPMVHARNVCSRKVAVARP